MNNDNNFNQNTNLNQSNNINQNFNSTQQNDNQYDVNNTISSLNETSNNVEKPMTKKSLFQRPFLLVLICLIILIFLGFVVGSLLLHSSNSLTQIIGLIFSLIAWTVLIIMIITFIKSIYMSFKKAKTSINNFNQNTSNEQKNKNLQKIYFIGTPIMFVVIICIIIFNSNFNNKSDYNKIDENNSDEGLVNCSNKGYFISLLQGEIYDRESIGVTITITNCSTSIQYDSSIKVSCNYNRKWNSMTTNTGEPVIDKLFHSNTYSCKE